MDPIIILASERSGTNLLRSLLDNHSNICAPPPPHLYKAFFKMRSHYGDLGEVGNMVRLLKDLIDFVNLDYHSWNLSVAPEEIIGECRPRSLAGAIETLWQAKASAEGKLSFACKDIDMFDFAVEAKAQNPRSRFIYLYRDPRDVVASWMKRAIAHFTPYNAASNWASNQRACFDLVESRGVGAHRISYESLVANCEHSMTILLEALCEPVESACFQTDRKKGQKHSGNPYWQNLSRPVITDNTGKFEGQFADQEIEMIESICSPWMEELGYEPTTPRAWSPSNEFLLENRRITRERREESRRWIPSEMPDLADKFLHEADLKQRILRDSSARTVPEWNRGEVKAGRHGKPRSKKRGVSGQGKASGQGQVKKRDSGGVRSIFRRLVRTFRGSES